MKKSDAGERFRGITLIEALGYKCLRYVRQEVRPFQILLGPNASGKSSFLDAVNFLSDLLKADLDTAVRGSEWPRVAHRAPDPKHLTWLRKGNAFEMAVELALPPQVRSRLQSVAGQNREYDRIRYELRVEIDPAPRIAVENLRLLPAYRPEGENEARPSALPERIVSEPLRGKPGEGVVLLARGISFDSGAATVYMPSSLEWNFIFAVSPQNTALANVTYDRERFPAETWLRDMLISGVRRIALNSEKMRLPSPPTLQKGYLPDGSNLPHVVARLEADAPERMKRWTAHLREALPDIERISTEERPEDRHRYLVVHYRNGLKAPSWLLSDGTLRMLALTLLAYTPDAEGGIYLIEEPENGIHPRAIETVFQSLSSVYGAQVLLATHSPIVVGAASLEQVLCFSHDSRKGTAVTSGDRHPRLKSWKGAMALSDLFAMGVLG